jgi:hypothetical protein
MDSVLILCYIVIKQNIPVKRPHAIYVGIINLEHITIGTLQIFVKKQEIKDVYLIVHNI